MMRVACLLLPPAPFQEKDVAGILMSVLRDPNIDRILKARMEATTDCQSSQALGISTDSA
jgi:hypothetical protein